MSAPIIRTNTVFASTTAAQASDAFTHTPGPCFGVDKALIAAVTITRAAVGEPSAVSGITFGLQNFVFVGRSVSFGAIDDRIATEIWYLINPNTAAATITVSYADTNNDARSISVTDMSNVDQVDPIGASSFNVQSSATTSISYTLATEQPESLIYYVGSRLGAATVTPTAGTIEISDQNAGTDHTQWVAAREVYGSSQSTSTNNAIWIVQGTATVSAEQPRAGVEIKAPAGNVLYPASIDSNTENSSGTTIGVDFTASALQEGDLFLVAIANTKLATAPSEQVTPPAGFSTLHDQNIAVVTAVRASVFYRLVPEGGLTSPLNFTLPTSQEWAYVYHSFRGVNPNLPVTSTTFSTGTSVNPLSPSETVLYDGSIALPIMWSDEDTWVDDVSSVPTDHDYMGAEEDTSPGATVAVVRQQKTFAGTTGTAQWTISPSEEWGAVTVVLNAVPYQIGEVIHNYHFNNLLGFIKLIYGVGFGNVGYGQTQYTLDTVAPEELINSSNWTNMRNALTIIRDYQEATASYTGQIPPTSELAIGEEIEAHISTAPTNDLYDFPAENLQSIVDLSSSAGGSFSGFITNTVTRATAWGAGASETIDCTVDLTFTSEDAARYFFNSLATLRIIMDHPDTTVGHNAAWNTTLGTIVGTVSMNTTSTTSTGTASGTADTLIGFYDLTDTLQTVYNGANIGPAGYTTNDVIIQARRLNFVGCNGGNGDGVRFVISLTDQDIDAVDSVAAGTNAQFSAFRTTTILVNPAIETPSFNVVDGF